MSTLQLVDSHCHLHLMDYDALALSLEEIIEQAQAAGVYKLLCVATQCEDHPLLLDLIARYPHINSSVGLHPATGVTEVREPSVKSLVRLLESDPKIVAVGETGLDYSLFEENSVEQQKVRFRTHIRAARESGKPLIIHSRAAGKETLALLKEEKAVEVGGVFHCFTEDWELASKAMDQGFYLSFSGIVTFKKVQVLRDVVQKMPLERLLIETDSPYLAPVPYRGKINHPANLLFIAECVAALKELPLAVLASQTTQNYHRLFGE